jgi:hypothetical protein
MSVMPRLHTTIAHPIVDVDYDGVSRGSMIALGVEIPLMVLAFTTVVLRAYSRLAIKRSLAADDVLIMLGTVS